MTARLRLRLFISGVRQLAALALTPERVLLEQVECRLCEADSSAPCGDEAGQETLTVFGPAGVFEIESTPLNCMASWLHVSGGFDARPFSAGDA